MTDRIKLGVHYKTTETPGKLELHDDRGTLSTLHDNLTALTKHVKAKLTGGKADVSPEEYHTLAHRTIAMLTGTHKPTEPKSDNSRNYKYTNGDTIVPLSRFGDNEDKRDNEGLSEIKDHIYDHMAKNPEGKKLFENRDTDPDGWRDYIKARVAEYRTKRNADMGEGYKNTSNNPA